MTRRRLHDGTVAASPAKMPQGQCLTPQATLGMLSADWGVTVSFQRCFKPL